VSETKQTFLTDKSTPGHWRVTLDNPPINLIDDRMYDAFYDLVGEIEGEPALKVVTFESANPDFFPRPLQLRPSRKVVSECRAGSKPRDDSQPVAY